MKIKFSKAPNWSSVPGIERPSWIGFDLSDLGSDYFISPIDELFRTLTKRLELPNTDIAFHVPYIDAREEGSGSATLRFISYKGKESFTANPPSVEYTRKIFQRSVGFNDPISKGKITPEKIADFVIKRRPVSQELEVNFDEFKLKLTDLYNYEADRAEEELAKRMGISSHKETNLARYTFPVTLAVYTKTPWVAGLIGKELSTRTLTRGGLEELASNVTKIVDGYVSKK